MGRMILLSREIASGAVVYLKRESDGEPAEAALQIRRYVAIFTWLFKARLRDGEDASDVVRAVLSEEDAAWLLAQRSPVTASISRIRHLLQEECLAGKLAPQMHFKLEQNLFDLYQAIGGCERLFTSPIPPTMTRHVVRSIALWFLFMPVRSSCVDLSPQPTRRAYIAVDVEPRSLALASQLALIGSMPTLPIILFTAATAYIFLGIEELGVQVEQPFDILPLWQICHLAMRNVEETILNFPGGRGGAQELPLFELTAPVWETVPLHDGGRLAPIWQGNS